MMREGKKRWLSLSIHSGEWEGKRWLFIFYTHTRQKTGYLKRFIHTMVRDGLTNTRCDSIWQNPPLDTLAEAPFSFKIAVTLRFQSKEKNLWQKCLMVGFADRITDVDHDRGTELHFWTDRMSSSKVERMFDMSNRPRIDSSSSQDLQFFIFFWKLLENPSPPPFDPWNRFITFRTFLRVPPSTSSSLPSVVEKIYSRSCILRM